LATHLVIPDTQVRDGVNTDHLRWIGQYMVDKKPDVVIHLGDHWDMPSLSSWDRGKIQFEGRRYEIDIASGNAGFALLNGALKEHEAERRRQKKKKSWKPRLVFLRGNHEQRVMRTVEDNAVLEGTIGYHDMDTMGWEVHDFLEPVFIDGVGYAHYWYNPMSGKPYGGNIELRLKNVGHTFTMGHQQVLQYGVRFVGGRSQHGLIAGAAYTHIEDYKGPQGNEHWRGVIMKHEVNGGSYDPMFVSLNYLCNRYEGVPLAEYLAKV
jgi:predicted phosphodiesterase